MRVFVYVYMYVSVRGVLFSRNLYERVLCTVVGWSGCICAMDFCCMFPCGVRASNPSEYVKCTPVRVRDLVEWNFDQVHF